MTTRDLPTTYADALAALKGRTSRKIANNTTLVAQGEGVIGLRLHSTFVVLFDDSGNIILNSGGYCTVTTKQRINAVIRAHGWTLYAKAREWFIAHREGGTFRFREGFTIPPPRVTEPVTDARVENHGSLFLVRALTRCALAWLTEHTDGQWLGNGLAVEPRYVESLVDGLREHGFVVEAA